MSGRPKIGALTPEEIAARCVLFGARVEKDGNRWVVYPPNREKRPVYFKIGVLRNGTQLDNLLRDLRHSDLDIEQDPPTTKPSPKPGPRPAAPQEVPTVSAPERRSVPAPMATQREVSDVREQVRNLSDNFVEMLANAERRIEKLEGQVHAQAREIAALRASGGRGDLPPTRAEITRGVVLAYFESIPGHKTTPQLVEMNIADDLPEGYGKTDVAGACGDLFKAGKLNGVPKKDGAGRERGIYWYAPPVDTADGDNPR